MGTYIPAWLQLSTSILDDEKISIIRTMPSGDSMFVLWVGLLCMAMKKQTDVLYVAQGMPYSAEAISTVTKLDIQIVKMGMDTFSRFGMISITDDGGILITNFNNYQAIDSMKRKRLLTAERVKKFRNKAESIAVTRYGVTSNATELEVEVDKEGEERERREDKACASYSTDSPEEKEAPDPVPQEIPKYPEMVFAEWAALGDKVFQPAGLIQFLQTWSRDIAPFVRGVHSDDVLAAIRNLGIIVAAPKGTYYWKFRIGIVGFLSKHLEKFLPKNFNVDDFAPTLSFKGQEEAETAKALREVFGKGEA